MPVLTSYVSDHAVSLRISANADFSTTLECLASGESNHTPLCPCKLLH